MKNLLVTILICCACGQAVTARVQQPGRRVSEAQETLRFLRLAETRKNLDFSDEKLLALNDILDDFEKERFNLTRERQKLHRLLMAADSHDDAESTRLLEAFVGNKQKILASELAMVDRVKKILTPAETLRFVVFYEKFQRDLQRKLRLLQNRGKANRGGDDQPTDWQP